MRSVQRVLGAASGGLTPCRPGWRGPGPAARAARPARWPRRTAARSTAALLLSDSGMALENISRLVGRKRTAMTGKVHRKQLRPVLLEGAEAMDQIFPQA
ncbi:hypothetical protein OHA77_20840 [Streptosporangium sp. NBC_01639]|uniref:hypothetical protein n=1 Tax=Streptosporangium sp. NBC_01639 TaxID=2975948 RepID=UPI003868F7D9|nr:hypothetical protein OHA77_20840 [Streptosporangium sp. NBC_01639]